MKRTVVALAGCLLIVAGCYGAKASEAPATSAAASAAVASPSSGAEAPSAAVPSASPSAPSGAGVVKMLVGLPEDPAVEAKYQELYAEFERQNPDIKIERETVGTEQLRTIAQTRLSSDSSPDILGYDTGPGFGGVLAKAGLVADMTQAYADHDWGIYDWAASRCTYAGKVSCIPDSVESLGIYYNKDLFAKHGFEVPKTLAELETIADAFKADGVTPLAFGNQPQWPAGHQFSMLASNLVGRKGLDDRLFGDAAWNSPEIVEAIDIFFNQFKEKGYFPKDPNAIDYEDSNALFYAAKAAMLPTGSWLTQEIANKQLPFEVGYFPFPSVDGAPITQPAGIGGGTFISANAQNPAGALRLMDWLLQPEQAKWELENAGSLPAHPVDIASTDLAPLAKEIVSGLAASSTNADSFGYNLDVLTPAEFNDIMFTGFQEVLNGTRTPQEQADALQAAYQKAKAAGETLERP